jgi:hypothetical protein
MNLFGERDPVVVVERATAVAESLADVIEKKQLFRQIGKKKHVYVEGWTLLGSMLGVFPVVEWTREMADGAWEARVVAVTRTGETVGAAEAMCSRAESSWKSRDDYAIRSMAQTRATSKALRLPLGFVMTLAGYESTPSEEIQAEEAAARRPFDPGKDRLEGAIWGESAKEVSERLKSAMEGMDHALDWDDLTLQLPGDRDTTFLRRLSNALEKITQEWSSEMPPPKEVIVKSFAWSFEGAAVEPTWAAAPEPEDDGDAPLAGTLEPETDDSIPFGEDQGEGL